MTELWCDFDGVVVANELHNINTSNISPQEFAALATRAYRRNPIVSDTIKQLMADYRRQGATVNIITGRKQAHLAELTEQVVREHGLCIDTIYYYPEEAAYIMSDYYAWKASVIGGSLGVNRPVEVRVIDDDRGLLEHLQKNLVHVNLRLSHYEFFADGQERMADLGRSS